MKALRRILSLQMRMRLRQLNPFDRTQNEKKSTGFRRLIGIIILLLMLAGMAIFLEFKILDALLVPKMEKLILGIIVFAAMLSTLFFGLFQCLSTFYFAKDTAQYAALPISGRTLYAARAIQVYLSECILSLLLILPASILLMIRTGFDILFLLRVILVALLAPVLPLSIGALLSALLASFSGLWRHRDAITMVGSIVLVMIQVVVNYSLGQVTGNLADDPELMLRFLTGRMDMIDMITGAFPPIRWAAHGLDGNWGELLLFCLVTLASAALVIWLCSRHYIEAALRAEEHPVTHHKGSLSKTAFRRHRPVVSLLSREMHEILRSPTYLVNEIMGTIFLPVIMTVGMGFGFASNFDGDLMAALDEILGANIGIAIPAAILTALVCFMAGMNSVASTSVSREGRHHGIYRNLPVRGSTCLWAKFLSGYIFSIIGIAIVTIVGMIALPKFCLIFALTALWSLLMCLIDCIIGIIIDVSRPRFHWNTEQEAMKQNFNQVLTMLIGMLIIGLLGFLTYGLFAWGMSEKGYIAVITLLLVILSAALGVWMHFKTSQRYACIDG